MSGYPGTIDPILLCLDPDLGSPRSRPFGPFVAEQTVGIYHNPQPTPGMRPILHSLSLTVRNSSDEYDVSLAPQWMAAWIPPSDISPSSPADNDAIIAAVLEQPPQHPFFFRPSAPNREALALAYLNNEGCGYYPPKDDSGRWWGLLVRADVIAIGGIVHISPNWGIERDPSYALRFEREARRDRDGG